MTDARSLWPAAEPGLAGLWWGWFAGRLGADPKLPRPFLIGIRGVRKNADATHEVVAVPDYDDTFVMLSPSAPVPYVFAGSTHPYQRDSKLSPDIDGDGRGDVGSIRALEFFDGPGLHPEIYRPLGGRFVRRGECPGIFLLTLALETPYPVFVLTMPSGSGNIPCARDTDHDGKLGPAEISRASYATAVLMHTGFDAPADSQHRSSIACQTANVADLRYLASHARAYDKKIDYVLIDAAEMIRLAVDCPYQPTGNNA